MQNEDFFSSLDKNFATLSKSHRQLASFINANYDKCAYLTAAKLGKIAGVSEPTVIRFAHSLGYSGYPQFQRSLQEMIRDKLTSVQRMELSPDALPKDALYATLKADIANLRQTIENIDANSFEGAIEALVNAQSVYILGLRSATPLAQFLGYYLNLALKDVRVLGGASGVYEQMINISSKDVCFGISFPRYSKRTVEAMAFAKAQNAKVISLTDCQLSPLYPLSDYNLLAKSTMASFADSLSAPLSVLNAVIVAVGLKEKNELKKRFDKLEAIWNTQGEYVNTLEEKGGSSCREENN